MHHKFAVVDGTTCVHGSLNWTTGALRNNRENIIFSKHKGLIAAFAAEFDRLWQAFAPKARRDISLAPDAVWNEGILVLLFPDRSDYNFKLLVQQVQSVKLTLDVAMFTLTVSELIAAMKHAHKRGVRVRVIVDDRQAKFCHDGAHCKDLRAAGIEVRMDHSPANMHHKFCVIDGRTVCNGSFNWTRQAEDGNYENVVVYHEQVALARCFSKEFETLWAEFAPSI